jgi:hypothetical protein
MHTRASGRESESQILEFREWIDQLDVTAKSRLREIYRVLTHPEGEIRKVSDREYRRDET